MQMKNHSKLYVNQKPQFLLLFSLEKALFDMKTLHYFLHYVTKI